MGCGSGSSNTTTVKNQPPQALLNAYTSLLGRGNQVSQLPLQQYGGSMVAGFTPAQQQAFGTINASQGIQQPYINTASQYAGQGAAPVWPGVPQFDQSQVDKYLNPYTNDVVNSTLGNINQQNQIQQSQLAGNAIQQGNSPFGGDRAGVAAAELARNQDLAKNQTIAQLYQQGYGQALGEFNTQQQTQIGAQQADAARAANAAYQFGGLGSQAQSGALQGASAQLQSGAMQQSLAQEQLNVPYEQFLQRQAYPFQTTQFLGGLTEGLAPGFGGTSTTTTPGPSTASQIAGLGLTGLGLAGSTGAFGTGGWLSSLGIKRGGRVPGYADGGGIGDFSGGAGGILAGYEAMPIGTLQRLAAMAKPGSLDGQRAQQALLDKFMAKQQSGPGMPPVPPTAPFAGGPPEFGQMQGMKKGGLVLPAGWPTGLPMPGNSNHSWTKTLQQFIASNDPNGYIQYLVGRGALPASYGQGTGTGTGGTGTGGGSNPGSTPGPAPGLPGFGGYVGSTPVTGQPSLPPPTPGLSYQQAPGFSDIGIPQFDPSMFQQGGPSAYFNPLPQLGPNGLPLTTTAPGQTTGFGVPANSPYFPSGGTAAGQPPGQAASPAPSTPPPSVPSGNTPAPSPSPSPSPTPGGVSASGGGAGGHEGGFGGVDHGEAGHAGNGFGTQVAGLPGNVGGVGRGIASSGSGGGGSWLSGLFGGGSQSPQSAQFAGQGTPTGYGPSTAGGDASGQGGYGFLNLGPLGAGALQAGAMFAPGWAGAGLSAIQAGLRGYNTATANNANQGLGGPGLDLGQWAGGILGLNNYGSLSGNNTIANRSGLPGEPKPTAVTTGGIYNNDPLGGADILGLFSDPRTSYTPAELVQRRNTSSLNPTTSAAMRAAGNGGFGGGNPNTAQAYGMHPGSAGKFGPAIVSGNDNPNPLGDKQLAQQQANGLSGWGGGTAFTHDNQGNSTGLSQAARDAGFGSSAPGPSTGYGGIARGGRVGLADGGVPGDNDLWLNMMRLQHPDMFTPRGIETAHGPLASSFKRGWDYDYGGIGTSRLPETPHAGPRAPFGAAGDQPGAFDIHPPAYTGSPKPPAITPVDWTDLARSLGHKAFTALGAGDSTKTPSGAADRGVGPLAPPADDVDPPPPAVYGGNPAARAGGMGPPALPSSQHFGAPPAGSPTASPPGPTLAGGPAADPPGPDAGPGGVSPGNFNPGAGAGGMGFGGAEATPTAETPAPPPSGQESNFFTSPWAAVLAAGLGTLAGRSPHAAENIGQGGLEGLRFAQQGQAMRNQERRYDAELAWRKAQEAHYERRDQIMEDRANRPVVDQSGPTTVIRYPDGTVFDTGHKTTAGLREAAAEEHQKVDEDLRRQQLRIEGMNAGTSAANAAETHRMNDYYRSIGHGAPGGVLGQLRTMFPNDTNEQIWQRYNDPRQRGQMIHAAETMGFTPEEFNAAFTAIQAGPAGNGAAATPATAGAPAPGGPTQGAVVDGFRFKGGNPNDKANWEPVQ